MEYIYIYISEDGTPKQSITAPTKLDMKIANDGLINILRTNGRGVEEYCDGEWTELATSNIVSENFGKKETFHD